MTNDNLIGNRRVNVNDSSQELVGPFIFHNASDSESQTSSAPTPQSGNMQSNTNTQPSPAPSAPAAGRVIEVNGDPRDSIVNNVSNSVPPSPFIFPQSDNIQLNTNTQPCPAPSAPAAGRVIEVNGDPRDSIVNNVSNSVPPSPFIFPQSDNIQLNMNTQHCPAPSAPAAGRMIEVNGDPSDLSMRVAAVGNGYAPQQQALTNVYTNMPAQQPPAPVYQQPVTTVSDKSDAGESWFEKNNTVIVDEDKNRMYLLKVKVSTKESHSSTSVNFGQNYVLQNKNNFKTDHGIIEIAKGTIFTSSKVTRSKETFLLVMFKGENGTIIDDELTYDQINTKKILTEKLLSAGINFNASYLKYIIVWLRTKYNEAQTFVEPCDSIREDGRPFYRDEHLIRQKAADGLWVKEKISLCIKDKVNGDLNLFLLAFGCVSKVTLFLSVNKLDIRTAVSFCANDLGRAVDELSKMYSLDESRKMRLSEYNAEILDSNGIVLFVANGETDYKLKKFLPKLSGDVGMNGILSGSPKESGLPILVFDDRSLLKKFDMSKYFIIPYSTTDPSDLTGILCWFQKMMMDNERFASDLLIAINNFRQKISEEQNESPKTDFFAVLLGAARTILKYTVFSEEIAKEIDNRFYNWLDSASVDSSLLTEKFCSYLKSCNLQLKDAHDYTPDTDDQKTLYLWNDCLCITRPLFVDAAAGLNMESNLLIKQLNDDGFLVHRKDNFQWNVRTKLGEQNFYVIPLSKLYEFGEVRMHISEFTENQPYKKIPFGLNVDSQIYFCINKYDHSENCHMYISGVSGSGKSHAVKKFAVEAHRQGIEVLNIGVSGSTLDFDDADYVDLFDVSNGSKAALSDVFNAVKQENLSEQCRCLLNILEESVEDTAVAADLKKWEDDYFPPLDNGEGRKDLFEAVRALYCSGRLNWQRWCSTDKITVLEADDKDTIDRLFTELYKFKSTQKSSNKCMLIVDECQELDLSQKSPLVRLLKQGRKYGVMVVLISQFLTSEDGKGIEDTLKQCTTKVVFKPGADKKSAKYIEYDLKDSNVYDAVCDIGNYQCVVKGNFCTDSFKINYPLILQIPE